MFSNSGKSHNGGQKALMGRCAFYPTELLDLDECSGYETFQLLS